MSIEYNRHRAWVEFLKKYGDRLDADQWQSYLYMATDDPDRPFPPQEEDAPRINLSTFITALSS